MKVFKKIVSVVIAYAMLIAILPTGLFTVAAKAEESVPQYLKYSELYFTSVGQYKDKTLVSYNYGSNYGEFKSQISLFQNGTETKVLKSSDCFICNVKNDIAKIWNRDDEKYSNYSFSTGTISSINEQDQIYKLTDEQKKEIIDKINTKYSKSFTVNDSNIYEERYTDENGEVCFKVHINSAKYDEDTQSMKYFSCELVYNKEILSSCENGRISIYTDFKNKNLLIYNTEEKTLQRIQAGKVVSTGTVDSSLSSIISINGDTIYAFTKDGDSINLTSYILIDGKYKLDKVIYKGGIDSEIKTDINGNMWFLQSENDRNFIYKIENGMAVKKYEVSPIMRYLHVYDDNNLVVTSESGSTIINVATKDKNNTINNTVENKVTITNENSTTTAEVTTVDPIAKNIINITGEEKQVVVNLKDIQSIKDGTGAVEINLGSGTKINMPFSLIDKTLLEGATNVKVKYNAIENSDLVKGLKAVNKVFDFSLEIEYGDTVKSIHQFANGVAEVTLQLTDVELKDLNRDKIKVLYYNEETKKYEVMETTVNGNYITFKTSHFSKFIVAEVDESGAPVNSTASTTKTGDFNGSSMLMIALALSSLAVVGICNLKNNRRKC